MQIVRTLLWVLVLVAIVVFSLGNFESGATVKIWPGMVWDTKIPAVVIVSFLAGLVPMWMYHRGVKWSQSRRIRSLENAVKSNALSARHQPTADTASPGAAGDTFSPTADRKADGS